MINIVIPMAGRGQRFADKGYTFPKPLIEINNKPMIHIITNNLRLSEPHRFVYIALEEHAHKYALSNMLKLIAEDSEMVTTGGVTQGAACTVLLAKEFFDNTDEMIIANSDQFLDMKIDDFVRDARKRKLDGSIVTFSSTHPKWSYALTDEGGQVIEVQEKKPISTHATVGIYYYRQGHMFANGAQEMIRKNIRTNNEFYVAPVFNEMILNGANVGIYEIPGGKMYGLGTPEDLDSFLKSPIAAHV